MKSISEFFYRLTKTPLMPATRQEYLKRESIRLANLILELYRLITLYKCQKNSNLEILDFLAYRHRAAVQDWKSIAEKLDAYKSTKSIFKCER